MKPEKKLYKKYIKLHENVLNTNFGDCISFKMSEEKLNKLTDEIDSFLIESYKEFFGKEYKEGDAIPEDKQKEWSDFIYNKYNKINN